MDPTSPEVQAELTRRHKAAATTVIGLLVATVLLSIVAFLSRPYLNERANPPLELAMRITILVLSVGAVAWRRTKLSPMRLRDIVGLAGVSGLLKTLEKTTLQMALLGAGVAAMGFVSTLAMGSEWYTYWAGIIAIVVFLYSYPRKSAWVRDVQSFSENPNAPAPENEE